LEKFPISKLAPRSISNDFIEYLVQLDQEIVLIKGGSGFLIPVKRVFMISPTAKENEITYVGFFERVRMAKSQGIIMTTKEGIIEGITREVADKIPIAHEFIESDAMNICQLFSGLKQYYSTFEH